MIILTLLAIIFVFGLSIRITCGLLRVCGKIIGFGFSLVGSAVIGVLALVGIGLMFSVGRLLLVAAVIAVIAAIVKR